MTIRVDAATNTVTKEETRTLRTQLTADELAEAAETLAHATQELEKLEDEKKSFGSSIKARIDEASAKQRGMAAIVASKHDWREVRCSSRRDFDAQTLTVVRLDTGEVVESRRLRESELQTALPFGEEGQ